ncbi:MAG TPA: SDR family oxidoreductase [Terrimesophilobacter sp.]|nr:SDR family oxidoreductase [Terrimesophilobacter sp.]
MSEMELTGKLAVVTGATGGIGTAICQRLHQDGFGILAQFHTNHAKAETIGQTIREDGGYFKTVSCDLGTPEGVCEVLSTAREVAEQSPGRKIHALVNNAAKLLGPAFDEATIDQFDEYFALNVRAPFFLSQGLSRLMSTGGSIVNISSAGAHFSSPGDIVYAMSKAALESLTRNMAEAIAARGLRVNSVVPGFTDNGHEAFRNVAALEYMSSFSVLGGVSDPSTVAEVVSFLVSDRASRTTGTAVDVSGGSTLGARKRTASSIRHVLPTPPEYGQPL